MLDYSFARHCEPELMDQPGLDVAVHRHALQGLARINRISRSTDILWRAILRLAASDPQRTWRVLDLACGGGDVTLGVARRAQSQKLSLQIDGCDISPVAVQYARERASNFGFSSVHFFAMDALKSPLPDGYDIVMCSLFLHHLDQSTAEQLLAKMSAAARHLVLVNDLRRTYLGYIFAWIGCRLLTRSPIVHTDGPLSARAAYTTREVSEMAARCGLDGARISRHWPERYLLQWNRC